MASATSTSSSSGPLSSSSLRRLMSLDSPRVALGKRCDLVKEEKVIQGSSLSLPSPVEVPIMTIKNEPNDWSPSSVRFSCSLCTSRPGDEKLSSFCPPDHRRAHHLASLLGRSEEEVDIIFCPVCRQTVRKLFKLREEVEEIESRIRAVVKLHPLTKSLGTLGTLKLESLECCTAIEVGKSNDGDLTSLVQEPPTPIEETGSKDGQHDDEAISQPSDRAKGPAKKSSRPWGRYRKNNNLQERRTVDVGTLPPIKSINKGGSTLFRCQLCPQMFTVKSSVFTHLGLIHGLNVSRKMICPICKKRFVSIDLFKAHNHPDKSDPSVVSYKCHLCQKSYPSTRNLLVHTRQVHLKKDQGNCPHCGKQFQSKCYLQFHIGATCPLVSKDVRKCHYCRKVFASGADRLKHETVAHKTKCYFCPKVLLKSSSLFLHVRIHTRERPYLCDKCGKDFVTPSAFRYHMAAVCGTDERKKEEAQRRNREKTRRQRAKLLYPCDLCVKRLGTKQELIKHQQRDH